MIMVVFLTSCEKNFLGGMKSTGDIIMQDREADSICQINLHDDMRLILNHDSIFKIKVEGGENIIDNFITEIDREKKSLTIKNLNTMNWLRDFRSERNVYLSIPYGMDSLMIDYYSSAGVASQETICLEGKLKVSVWSGAGSIDMDINCPSAMFKERYGTTDWNISGTCGSVIAILEGYGKMSLIGLENANVYFGHGGTNDMLVAPYNVLSGKINGSGKVKCYSKPENVSCTPENSPNLIFVK